MSNGRWQVLFQLLFLLLLLFVCSAAESRHLWTELTMWHSQDGIKFRATATFSCWGWSHSRSMLLSVRLFPLSKVFAIAFVTDIHTMPQQRDQDRFKKKDKSEREDPWRQHQPHLCCPNNSALAPNSHMLLNYAKGLRLAGPPSLDGGLRNICYDLSTSLGVSFLSLEQLIKVFLLLHLAHAVSFSIAML